MQLFLLVLFSQTYIFFLLYKCLIQSGMQKKSTCCLDIVFLGYVGIFTLWLTTKHEYIFKLSRNKIFARSRTYLEPSGRLWLFWPAWWRENRCTCLRQTVWHHWCWWSTPTRTHAPAQSCCPLKLTERQMETDKELANITNCLNTSKLKQWGL